MFPQPLARIQHRSKRFWVGKAVILPDFNQRLGWQAAVGNEFF
jgi:hypothetical protein